MWEELMSLIEFLAVAAAHFVAFMLIVLTAAYFTGAIQ